MVEGATLEKQGGDPLGLVVTTNAAGEFAFGPLPPGEATLLVRHPERIIRSAVKGMLPKTRLGRKMLSKLKVYAGEDHPHQAQNPEPLKLAESR